MPYDVLEAQIKSLPEVYYNELVDYLEFLIQKADKEKKSLEIGNSPPLLLFLLHMQDTVSSFQYPVRFRVPCRLL